MVDKVLVFVLVLRRQNMLEVDFQGGVLQFINVYYLLFCIIGMQGQYFDQGQKLIYSL